MHHTHFLQTSTYKNADCLKMLHYLNKNFSKIIFKNKSLTYIWLSTYLCRIPSLTPQAYMSHRKPCKTPIFAKCHYNSGEVEGLLWQRPLAFLFFFLPTVSGAHRPRDTQRQYKQSHIMDSHNKLTLGSGWCSTQLMPLLIRAWKYYLGLAARSKKSILSQVINSALSDCSPIPGSSMSLSWLLPLKFSLWLALSC